MTDVSIEPETDMADVLREGGIVEFRPGALLELGVTAGLGGSFVLL